MNYYIFRNSIYIMEEKMKLKPIEDHIVVKVPTAVEEKTVGGIIIPDTAKEKPQSGEVIAVGTDEDLQKIVKVGDKVLYGKYSGTEVEVEGEKLLILSKDDILAIVE
jgi:chaperonin GroES